MRRRLTRLLAFASLLALVGLGRLGAAPGALPDLGGKWKLVVVAFGEDEFAIVSLKDEGGKLSAETVNTQAQLPGLDKGIEVKRDGDALKLTLGDGNTFTSSSAAQGPERILGTFRFHGSDYPARLEKTDDDKVAQLARSPMLSKIQLAFRERDPHARVQKLEKLLADYKDSPSNATIYQLLLQAAAEEKADAGKVKGYVDQWIASAKPYGEVWVAETQAKAIEALKGQAPYDEVRRGVEKAHTPLELMLAQADDEAMPEGAPLERKAKAATRLALAAKVAGKADLAAEAEAKAAKLDVALDEEYRKKVPPFKPEEFAGRKDKGSTKVVLMELFTGAQCPPCVAADVGFDALLETYKPTEFIGLQYHEHIPRPDPLTNADTVARMKYYGSDIGGTPTPIFNGKAAQAGGGPLAASETLYKQYRKLVEGGLDGKKGATIDLSARRVGDEVRIVARAEATGEAKDADLKLRLAVVEGQVRYAGTNGLRFHHHVVRAMPGGPEGKALEGGKGRVEQTLKLADLRKATEEYLSDFAKQQPFPTAVPALDLKGLSVVAFVQDDGDKAVLHAAQVDLDDAKAAETNP